jgi:TIR domain
VSAGPSESADVPAPKVFISYRREETAAYAGRLYDAMAPRFGDSNVFMDVDLEPGIDFVQRITAAVGACHVLIVVMGPRWATVQDDDGAVRIAAPGDFVRLEVGTALKRPDVTVIPVLVAGAQMPDAADLPQDIAPITRRNALELSDTRWRYDVGRLTRTLDERLAEMTATQQAHVAAGEPGPAEAAGAGAAARIPGATPTRRRLVTGLVALAVVSALAALAVVVLGGDSGGGGDSGVVASAGTQFESFTGAQHFTVDMPVGWREATVEEPIEGGTVERTQLQSLTAKRSLHILRGPEGPPQEQATKVLDEAAANTGFQNPQQETRTIEGRETQEFGYEFDQPGVGPVTVVNYAFNAGGFGWQTRVSVPTSDTSAKLADEIATEAAKTLEPR